MSDGDSKTTIWLKVISAPCSILNFVPWKRDGKENGVSEDQQISNNSNKSSNGWQRLKKLYTDGGVHFETGILEPCVRWTFIGTVLLKGATGWQEAAERYNRYSKGRVFLSPRDALRRKWDYAFASFLRTGAINGSFAALYVGCIIAAVTHVTAWRGHFSLWTVPLITTAVPFIISCPFGLPRMAQAMGLGLTCGLTLSLIVISASHFTNQTIDEVYQTFKQEHELEMRKERDRDHEITIYQKDHKIWFKGLAKLQMERDKRLEEEKVFENSSR